MLVDLARNDLGRVAELGSVHVDELMTVEDYAQVRHIVSNVRARLRSGADALDALVALFPGGTITGVPKVRCMQILDALEPVPRGFYTGALFYLTPSGRLDANILIRSAAVAGGAATFATGGGIVADSEPDHEYQETLHKAEGMRLALRAAGAPEPL
jgi:anthranilate/para-aminobenzoate synthase component I